VDWITQYNCLYKMSFGLDRPTTPQKQVSVRYPAAAQKLRLVNDILAARLKSQHSSSQIIFPLGPRTAMPWESYLAPIAEGCAIIKKTLNAVRESTIITFISERPSGPLLPVVQFKHWEVSWLAGTFLFLHLVLFH
jgi:hypothetical protein